MKIIIKLEASEIEALTKIGNIDCEANCCDCPYWIDSNGGYVCVSALCNGVLNKAKESEHGAQTK